MMSFLSGHPRTEAGDVADREVKGFDPNQCVDEARGLEADVGQGELQLSDVRDGAATQADLPRGDYNLIGGDCVFSVTEESLQPVVQPRGEGAADDHFFAVDGQVQSTPHPFQRHS